MVTDEPRHAAHAHEQAYDAVDAARGARGRNARLRLELQRRRVEADDVRLDPEIDATLRAILGPAGR